MHEPFPVDEALKVPPVAFPDIDAVASLDGVQVDALGQPQTGKQRIAKVFLR